MAETLIQNETALTEIFQWGINDYQNGYYILDDKMTFFQLGHMPPERASKQYWHGWWYAKMRDYVEMEKSE